MTWLDGLILGLVQGLTEFLPVSSSGHMMIARDILHMDIPSDEAFLSFEVLAHAATVLATIVVFRKELLELLRGMFRFCYNDELDYILKICVSMIPVFIVGMFFKDAVTSLFDGLATVGFALLATAVLLFVSDLVTRRREAKPRHKEEKEGISFKQAFIVGLAQAVAVIPGLSRSGSTISAGLLCGVRRSDVAKFSFLMVMVPILGETFLDLLDGGFGTSASVIGTLPLLLGFVTAFLSGLFACKSMISLVRRASLRPFAVYCLIVGITVLVFSFR